MDFDCCSDNFILLINKWVTKGRAAMLNASVSVDLDPQRTDTFCLFASCFHHVVEYSTQVLTPK